MAKQHKLTIADAHLQTILRAVTKLSWAEANPIIQSISVQLQAAEREERPAIDSAVSGLPATTAPANTGEEPAASNGHATKAPLI